MANQEQHDGLPESGADTPALTAQGVSRRRMAGLGASGVLLTIASNNAMAAMVCKPPSGALSGSLSSQKPAYACQGRSPGYWKNHPTAWPASLSPTDNFGKVLPARAPLGTAPCMDVLNGDVEDRHNVASHILATYLNVLTGRIDFLSVDKVVDMWTEYHTTQQFVPAKGSAPWSGSELVNYLKNTMS